MSQFTDIDILVFRIILNAPDHMSGLSLDDIIRATGQLSAGVKVSLRKLEEGGFVQRTIKRVDGEQRFIVAIDGNAKLLQLMMAVELSKPSQPSADVPKSSLPLRPHTTLDTKRNDSLTADLKAMWQSLGHAEQDNTEQERQHQEQSVADEDAAFYLLNALYEQKKKPDVAVEIAKANESLHLPESKLDFYLSALQDSASISHPINGMTSITPSGAQWLFYEKQRRDISSTLRQYEQSLQFMTALDRESAPDRHLIDGDKLLANMGWTIAQLKSVQSDISGFVVTHCGRLSIQNDTVVIGQIMPSHDHSIIMQWLDMKIGECRSRLQQLLTSEKDRHQNRNSRKTLSTTSYTFMGPAQGVFGDSNRLERPIFTQNVDKPDKPPAADKKDWLEKIPKWIKLLAVSIIAIATVVTAGTKLKNAINGWNSHPATTQSSPTTHP